MDQEAPIDSSLMLSEKFTPAALPEVCAPRRSLIGRFRSEEHTSELQSPS